jgi:PAS domain S-box-containing protein
MSAAPPNPVPYPDFHLWERIIESSVDGIVVFDRHIRFVVWNPAMERVTGIARHETIGRNVLEVFPFLKELGAERHLKAVLAGESVVADLLPYCFADTGRRGYAQAHYSPLRDETGAVVAGLTVIRDVTAQRRTHERLRESEHRFRTLFEEAPIAYHEIDRDGVVRRVNRAECELLGLTPDEIVNRPIWDFVAEDQREASRQAIRRKIRGEEPPELFRRDYVRRDGVRLTVEVHDKLIRDSSGNVVGIRSAMLDHTEKARVENVLRQTRDDLERRVRERTSELAHANEALQKEVLERGRAEQRLALQYAVARILAESDGISSAAPGILRVICENLGWDCGIYWGYNAQTEMLECQSMWRAAHALAGFTREDLEPESGLAGWVCVTREPSWVEDVGRTPEFPWGVFAARKGVHGGLVFPVMIGGQVFGVLAFFSHLVQPMDEELLKGTALIGSQIAQFIERRRAEEAFEQSEVRFATFMQQLPGMAFIKSLDGKYIYHNARKETLGGITGSEMIGKTDDEVFPPEFATLYRANDKLVLEMGTPLEVVEGCRQEGEMRYWLLYKFPIPDRNGRTAFLGGIGIDITERKQLEEQLRQSQKMEAIGRLAGGVAHDFNNLLTIISGYGRMVLDDLGPRHKLRPRVEEVLNAADRAAILTSQLLAFSRRQVVQPKILALNHVISNLEKMLRRVIGEYIELRTILSPSLDQVKADAGQLEQVIMNLSVNARDAMPEGGTLTIETSNVTWRKSTDPVESPARPYVCLSVRDSGVGMDLTTRSHLFEPFFTTKDRGKGTGLGLSTVYGIVKQHGGEIRVDSQPGLGTMFEIYLPVAEETATVELVPQDAAVAAKGTETVLLVEDEIGVRQLARAILKHHGYRVLEAADAREAIRLAQQARGPIHVLLTDVIMPLMSGRELVEQIKALRKDIRVIYMSGYTDDVLAYRGDLGADINFLQKPFAPEALAKKVRDALEG